MKKLLLLSAVCAFSFSMQAQDKVVVEDFDAQGNMNSWIDGENVYSSYFHHDSEAPGSLLNLVGRYDFHDSTKITGGNWIGTRVKNIWGFGAGDWGGWNTNEYPYYSIDVYSDSVVNISMRAEDKVSDALKVTIAEDWQDYTNKGEWQTLYWDLSAGQGLGGDVEMVFVIDDWNPGVKKTIYVDNITAYKTMPAGAMSIGEITGAHKATAFPNPASEQLNIQFDVTGAGTTELTVVNILGNIVYNDAIATNGGGIQTTTLDVSDFKSGVYSYVLTTNGVSSAHTFIVK